MSIDSIKHLKGDADNAANTCQRRNERHAYPLITYMTAANEHIEKLSQMVSDLQATNKDLTEKLEVAIKDKDEASRSWFTAKPVVAAKESQEETEKPFWKFW